MSLTVEERGIIVQLRMEKAKATFAELDILIANGLWRNAANRLYYACFYAAGALLINDGHVVHAHNGVKTLLSFYYIKTGIIDKFYSTFYGKLFNLRQTGDYDDMAIITEADVLHLLEPAKNFITTIDNLITARKSHHELKNTELDV